MDMLHSVKPVCVLRSGGDFKPEHVARLARHVPGLLCISDCDIPGVETKPLLYDWPGWWSKMEAYGLHMDRPILLIDLDTHVARMPAMPEVTTVLPNFYRPKLMGSGFLYVTVEDQGRIWKEWLRDPAGHMRRCRTRECWGDQGFLMPLIGDSPRWGSNVVSWKVHCRSGIPDTADVICWHGRPRPWKVMDWR